MTKSESIYKRTVVVTRTILGYELSAKQDVIANYLIPAITGCLCYILLFAADLGTVYRHFEEENPVWASLTLLFMFLPVIGCFIWVISSWELWPEIEGCGRNNVKWALWKVLQHFFFPIWSMWRYAEKIFWSIEALIQINDEEKKDEALENVNAPRIIEFYLFLQAFLQGIPQIILQIHILLRVSTLIDISTIYIQASSIILNLIKLSITTTQYQRFKSQKLGGKDYPWFKAYKYDYCPTIDTVDAAVPTRRQFVPQISKVDKKGIVYATRENAARLKLEVESRNNTPLPRNPRMTRRPSSDLYMLPSGIVENVDKNIDVMDVLRETSVIDGPQRRLFVGSDDEFVYPRRLNDIKGLPEDDIVGKFIAFCWWFNFLIARFLAICSFAYFYPKDIIWLMSLHFVIVEAFLLYDVKTIFVRHTRAVFFIFIGLIYIFCIIEFMKKFKNVKFVYYGFFTLVFIENFTMCGVWFNSSYMDYDGFVNDWWYQYIFYMVLICTLLSMSSMIFYIIINKPKSVVVDEEVVPNEI
ncbi:uncharacterized protein [Onthophagus taurus]|uniref:uncharacterized protein n=1 Tax=Onthophagus taurus TaxID=166361 RepID=UPI0039BEA275